MYYVRLEWKSECYTSFDVTYWNSKEKAQEKYRSILDHEYKNLFTRKPPKKWSDDKVSERINEKIDENDCSDYDFECTWGPITTED